VSAPITVLGVVCAPLCDGRDVPYGDCWYHETLDQHGVQRMLRIDLVREVERTLWTITDEVATHRDSPRGYIIEVRGVGPTLDAAVEDLIAQRIELVRRLTEPA